MARSRHPADGDRYAFDDEEQVTWSNEPEASPGFDEERYRRERAVRLPLLPRASYPSPSISLNVMAGSGRSPLGAVLSVLPVTGYPYR